MTNQPRHSQKVEQRRSQPADEPASLSPHSYADLCAVENLQAAYTHLKENFSAWGSDSLPFEAIEAEGVEAFLQQLSRDLQARTYKPAQPAIVRDLVVQAALWRLLETALPPASPCDPEQTIRQLAGKIDKGFSRVYAVTVGDGLAVKQHERLLARVQQQLQDTSVLRLLAVILAAAKRPEERPSPLLRRLADLALEDIDPLLEQARALGREGSFLHVHFVRAANHLVVLADPDPRYEWLLPAVQKRLREELAKLHYDPAALKTQSVDLTRGGVLHFLGFELRLLQGKHGEVRVRYRCLEEIQCGRAGGTSPQRSRGRFQPLRLARPGLDWIGSQPIVQVVPGACHKLHAIEVGWRQLPIVFVPALLILFGWRSPIPWLCLALLFVCDWRWTLSLMRSAGLWMWRHKLGAVLRGCVPSLRPRSPSLGSVRLGLSRIGRQRISRSTLDAGRKLHAIKVGWRQLPIVFAPALLVLFSWRSPVPWLCLALVFTCNWRWTLGLVRTMGIRCACRIWPSLSRRREPRQASEAGPLSGEVGVKAEPPVPAASPQSRGTSVGTWVWRHKLETVLGACLLASLICLVLAVRDPATLEPVLLISFSWRSPILWLGAALLLVGTRRRILSLLRSVGRWTRQHKLDVVLGVCAVAALSCLAVAICEPLALGPAFLLLRGGWRSPVPWLWVALIIVCSWRWTPRLARPVGRWVWRHKLDVMLSGCAVAALVFLVLSLEDWFSPLDLFP